MPLSDFRIGLPAWAFPGWKDRYFSETPSRLASYARVFNTVEGNTTFYRIPGAATVRNWRDAVAGTDFRFCFKLPRDVTHERTPDLAALNDFVSAIEPLGTHLGPLLVQFPARIGPEQLTFIADIVAALPGEFSAVIEVRHPQFFDQPELLKPLLDNTGAGRVVLDSRPLYEGNRDHPDVAAALHEKPDLPVLPEVYNDVAFVRLILHPDLGSNRLYIEQWARRTAAYLDNGDAVFMMIHCPNNLHCPPLALDFHTALCAEPTLAALPPLPPLPAWPVPQQHRLL